MNSLSKSSTKSSTSTEKESRLQMGVLPQTLLGMMSMAFINGMLSYFDFVTLNLSTLWMLVEISSIPCILYLMVKEDLQPILMGLIVQNFTATIALAFSDHPSFSASQQLNAGILYYLLASIILAYSLSSKRT